MVAVDIYFGFEAPSSDVVLAIVRSVPPGFAYAGGVGVFDDTPERPAVALVALAADGVSVTSTVYWGRRPPVGGRICGVSITFYPSGGVLFGVGTDAENVDAVLEAFAGLGAREVLVVDEQPPPETFAGFRRAVSESS